MYCLRCNQPLYAMASDQCPVCNLHYDATDVSTYRSRPMLLRWKFWFPGLCLSIVSGVVSYALCLQSGELGFALFVAVPISVGAILGYATRAHILLSVLMGVVAIVSIVLMLVSMHLAGFFCGMTLGLIFLLPVGFGAVLGLVLRSLLKASAWDQRWFLPVIFLLALPYGIQAMELLLPHRREMATVRTRLTVDASPQEAWNAIVFYEQVQHEPPWLLRLALPKPLRSEGNKSREGEIVRCYYDRGYLSKRITRLERHRLLAFDVVEQELHFERDVRLLGGNFLLIPEGPDSTRIELTTRYERLLSPRLVWRPIERKVIHTLHGHVLEGMRRKAERQLEPSRDAPTCQPGTIEYVELAASRYGT
jgi:hypothetical protein